MEFFSQLFFILLCLCLIAEIISRRGGTKKHVETSPGFKSFQITYLVVYLINMGADWMQGPYVYALYAFYGYNKEEIALLFLTGFFSSMVFGTFVGAISDKYGRRKMGILFGVFYGASCIMKLWSNFYILLFGRVLSGIATSLLFSVFEAWMINEHHKRGYSSEGLSQTFSYATFGNGCVAILSSITGSFIVEHYGFVGPYMCALGLLITGSLIVAMCWTENYGDTTVNISGTFSNAISALKADKKIAVLGGVQSLFEASMYTFVFMWTPALAEGHDRSSLPFGLIFDMVAIMIGSSLFKISVIKLKVSPVTLAQSIFGIAALALATPILTKSKPLIAIGFCIFEVACGMYWPCLEQRYVPEASRAAIMSFFRVPLNLLVVLALIKVSSFSNNTVFMICVTWLSMALVGQIVFSSLTTNPIPRGKKE